MWTEQQVGVFLRELSFHLNSDLERRVNVSAHELRASDEAVKLLQIKVEQQQSNLNIDKRTQVWICLILICGEVKIVSQLFSR